MWHSPLCFLSHWDQITNTSHPPWALMSDSHSSEWPWKDTVFKPHQPITYLNWTELSTWTKAMTSLDSLNRCWRASYYYWGGLRMVLPKSLALFRSTWNTPGPSPPSPLPSAWGIFIPLSDKDQLQGLKEIRKHELEISPLCLNQKEALKENWNFVRFTEPPGTKMAILLGLLWIWVLGSDISFLWLL